MAIYDVVIAGTGPVGLFLASELRLADLSVLVLEQAENARAPLKMLPFGLRALSTPTVEGFYRRGLLDAIAASQPANDASGTAHWMKQTRKPGGHFAGSQFYLDNIDASKWTIVCQVQPTSAWRSIWKASKPY